MNNLCWEEFKEQGDIVASISCDECDYDTGVLHMRDAVFMVNMQGGYFMFDGEGGAISKCPMCGLDKLITVD